MKEIENKDNTKEVRYCGIDPSTKTGFVLLDSEGKTIKAIEVKSQYKDDPRRMIDIVLKVMRELKEFDIVCIENFSFGSTGQGVSFQYGLGWLFRAFLYRKGIKYIEIAPQTLKKVVALSGRAKKEQIMQCIKEQFSFSTKSDNIADAYGLAVISMCLYEKDKLNSLKKEQTESINKIRQSNNIN